MDSATTSATDDGTDWIPLVDASDLPIIADFVADGTVLARALRRVIASLDDPNGVISAFDSFAADG